MLEMINRSAAILKPKRPYLEWMKLDDSSGIAGSVFESMRDEPIAVLLPDLDDGEERNAIIENFWPALFEALLEAWNRDPGHWPKSQSRKMFDEWVEFQVASPVFDAYLDEELMHQ